MNELIVKISYSDTTDHFSAFDVQKAMEHLFGINTDFNVEEITVCDPRKKHAINFEASQKVRETSHVKQQEQSICV